MTKKIKVTLSLLGLASVSALTIPLVLTSCSSDDSSSNNGSNSGSSSQSVISDTIKTANVEGKYSFDLKNTNIFTIDSFKKYVKDFVNGTQSELVEGLKESGAEEVFFKLNISVKDNILTNEMECYMKNTKLNINELKFFQSVKYVMHFNAPELTGENQGKYKIELWAKIILPGEPVEDLSDTMYITAEELKERIPEINLK